MTENYTDRLRKYVEGLEWRIGFEEKALEALPTKGDLADETREPVVRTIVAYQRAISNLYELFPELRPTDNKK